MPLSTATPMPVTSGLGSRIAVAVQNGQITSSDRRAMDMAISAIDSSLVTASGAGQLGRGDMQLRIDSLIKAQVASGTISSGQAAELRAFFGAGVPDPPDSREEPEAPPPPPPPSEPPPPEARAQKPSDTDARGNLDSVFSFIQQLRDRTAVSNSGYGTLGTSPNARRSPFVLDIYA